MEKQPVTRKTLNNAMYRAFEPQPDTVCFVINEVKDADFIMKRIIDYKYVQGMTDYYIACKLNMTTGAVNKQINRYLDKLVFKYNNKYCGGK